MIVIYQISIADNESRNNLNTFFTELFFNDSGRFELFRTEFNHFVNHNYKRSCTVNLSHGPSRLEDLL